MSKVSMGRLALSAALLIASAAAWAVAMDSTQSASGTFAVPPGLVGLDVSTGSDGAPVVTLSADGKIAWKSFLLADPHRLVLDLEGVVNRLDSYRYAVNAGGVVRARAGQHQLDPVPVTRVVFDLDRPLGHRVVEQDGKLIVTFGGEPTVDAADSADLDAATTVATLTETVPTQALTQEAVTVDPAPAAAPASRTTPAAVDANDALTRGVDPGMIERLLRTPPAYAAPQGRSSADSSRGYETKTIVTDSVAYTGKVISLNLVDAETKQVFRLFHEISGLNFVLDPGVGGRVTIVLDNVPWDQALDIILKNNGLDKVLENNVIRIASTQKLAQEAASRKQLKEAKELEVEPITITRTLSYGKAADVERVIRDSGILSTRGKAIVDERTNTVIISDIPKKLEPLDVLISTLDAETPQVMIEARIVETSRDFVRDLGVIWNMSAIADASKGTATGLAFPHNASVKYGLNLPGGGGASNLAFKFGNVIDSFTLDVALNALEREGEGRVLSSPKIATQNNEEAEIEQGVRIPIVNTTATEISVEYVSASLKMTVTPQITAEGTIILDVVVENNSPDFVNTAGGIPSIRTQRAQTKVLISDGGTTVIGGIFTVSEGKSEVGVPWFRKIPMFGWLFKSQNVTNQNRELLIFITPKIMRIG